MSGTTENIKRLFLQEKGLAAANLFRKSLYVYLVFNFIQLLPVMNSLYGEGSDIIPYTYNHFSLSKLMNLLSLPAMENLYYLFFAIQLLACVCGSLDFFPRLCALAVWFTTVNLDNRIYLMNTGGEQLLNIILFYLVFISPGSKKRADEIIILDTTFIAACKIQLVMVYFLSALFKLLQPEWLNGNALFYVFHMDEFSTVFLQGISENKIIVKAMSYFSLLYQLLFPFLIFFRKPKKALVICGVVLHLAIAFGIGLLNFSLVMICCYLLFSNEAWAEKWNAKISFGKTNG